MSECLFCQIASGEMPADVIYEDESILVMKDIYPKSETHLLMIPKDHFKDLPDIAASDPELLSYMMDKITLVAEQEGMHNGFRTIINTGAGGGQVIFHVHIHLLAGKSLPGF
ncbi:MAG: histidine triad nucleotide-binding protein [Gammaproteobacteria bacterium]|nr:histidine triad nucleotide-binding protein [Gammaproteobacteria bacterium]